jgi:alkylresorcinol/alkylpyrone synthase
MGWHISEDGFRIILSPDVPVIAREQLPRDVDAFLGEQRLTRADIGEWICHPGGPKVLQALQDGLGLTERDLEHSWQTLLHRGNLSSTSVLLVLRQTIDERRPPAGTLGLMLAMGPGFCSELLLLRW